MSDIAIGLAWRQIRDRFRAAGLDTPELDARILAQRAFGLDAMGLVRRERETADDAALLALRRSSERRLAGEPIARILGEKEFWGLAFELSEATLVPRPATETLVAEAVNLLEGRPQPHFVDLGTGSGAIAIAMLSALPTATALATDLSEEALATARRNAERHGVAGRVDFRRGSWWQAVPHTEMFDLVVSNPPYIVSDVIGTLAPEVRVFDPRLALDGGWDGLEAYRAIAIQAGRRLKPGGTLAMEIGATQGQALSRMLGRAGFGRVEVIKDLEGLDRVVTVSHS